MKKKINIKDIIILFLTFGLVINMIRIDRLYKMIDSRNIINSSTFETFYNTQIKFNKSIKEFMKTQIKFNTTVYKAFSKIVFELKRLNKKGD